MDPQAFVEIGTVTGAHGVKGLVRVQSHAGGPGLLAPGKTLWLKEKSGVRRVRVTSSAPHGAALLLGIEGIFDRNAAQALQGRALLIRRKDLPPAGPGEYYWVDLIGLSVTTREGAPLGALVSIIPTGANDVYVVQDGAGKETLVPALDWVVLDINLETRAMVVDLPEGL
jgi:16S rRNA processing protein RimM